jgi:hypothetical protein
MGKSILVYVTADEKRVAGGDPLTLLIRDRQEQQETITELSRALRADIVQLKNGDYVLIADN